MGSIFYRINSLITKENDINLLRKYLLVLKAPTHLKEEAKLKLAV